MRSDEAFLVYQGNDVDLACQYRVDGVPASLAGITIEAQVRNMTDAAIATLTVARLDDTQGFFSLRQTPAQTAAWPLGDLWLDIRYSANAGAWQRNTTPARLSVRKPLTR